MSPVMKILIYFSHFLYSTLTKITDRKVGFRRNIDTSNPRSVHLGHSRRNNSYILELLYVIFSNFLVCYYYYYPVTCVLCHVLRCSLWWLKITIFWAVMLPDLVDVYWCIKGPHCLHNQDGWACHSDNRGRRFPWIIRKGWLICK